MLNEGVASRGNSAGSRRNCGYAGTGIKSYRAGGAGRYRLKILANLNLPGSTQPVSPLVILFREIGQVLCKKVAQEVGVDAAYGGLLPNHKLEKVEALCQDSPGNTCGR